ncbi:MAG: PspC domain-containing protein [Bacteroidota bacterium]|jgi:phage shock protein PspC (stress-responsive transcriptional regulator)
MNKTVTINISGIIFHIEEDAYSSLSNYLNKIKSKFNASEGGNEILADIEARIAELLSQKINQGKQVIVLNDVNLVMDTLGKPEDFADDDNASKSTNTASEAESMQDNKRRLFRNPDDKMIGGVCSGIAAYLDVDLVWIRLAMFLLIFFGGLSLWVYIILWIVMPEAKTTADKLAMKGKPVTIDNISESVKNEFESLGTKYGKGSGARKMSDNLARGASNAANTVGNIIVRAIGLFIVFVAGSMLIGYLSTIFGFSVAGNSEDFNNWKNAIFTTGSDYSLAVLAFILVAGIPIFMLMYLGIKLLLNIKYKNKWLNIGLGVVWFIGFCLGISVAFKTVKQFSESSKVKEVVQLANVGDTLIVKANSSDNILKNFNFTNSVEVEQRLSKGKNDYVFGITGNQLTVIGNVDVDIVEANTDSIEVVVYYNSQGESKQIANNNAKNIQFQLKQIGNELILDQIFTVKAGEKFRAQDVDVKIKLPKGKVIVLDKSLRGLLDNVDNVTNTWDGDMINRRWYMGEKGLRCIDCAGIDTDDEGDYDERNENGKLIINGKEIKIDDKNTSVKIDKDGIKVKDNDADVKIDKHGINITTKEEKK